jgi:ecotin
MKMNKISFMFISLMVTASVNAMAAEPSALNQQSLEKVAPFPKAEKGMSRQVIYRNGAVNSHSNCFSSR